MEVCSANKITKPSFKVKMGQKQTEDDIHRQVQFCKQVLNQINTNKLHVKNVWTDLNGLLHEHNCRYCSDHDSRVFVEVCKQYPERISTYIGRYVGRRNDWIIVSSKFNWRKLLRITSIEMDGLHF